MVSHHPTNKLISREPISLQKPQRPLSHTPHAESAEHPVLAPISERYPKEKGRLLTCYSPVRHSHHTTTKATQIPFDLHVLSTPPAFVLSQDQTLQTKNKNHNLLRKQPPHNRAANPNQKNSKNKNKHQQNKHTIEFTNNTPTRPQPQTKGHKRGTITTNNTNHKQSAPPGRQENTLRTIGSIVKLICGDLPHRLIFRHNVAKQQVEYCFNPVFIIINSGFLVPG